MNTLERVKELQTIIEQLMKANQSLKTKEEREAGGFDLLYEAKRQIEWIRDDLEALYR